MRNREEEQKAKEDNKVVVVEREINISLLNDKLNVINDKLIAITDMLSTIVPKN